jgi:hypothetical protein
MKIPRLTLIVAALLFTSISYGDYQIVWYTIGGGGGQSAGGQYVLTGTIGQADTASSKGGNYKLLSGFWPGWPLCFVDFPNFTIFAEYWLQTGTGLPADLNGDGVVNIYDLKLFVDEWLCICPSNWPLK